MMMIKFKCRRMRNLLALWVGNDLDESHQFTVRRHVIECPSCRDYWQQLQASQQVIEASRFAPAVTEHRSLWPAVRSQLAVSLPASAWGQPLGWLPVGALAAACVAVWFGAVHSPAFTQFGRTEQKLFDGPAALPVNPASVSTLTADRVYDPHQPSGMPGGLRAPAVPVSETQYWSF